MKRYARLLLLTALALPAGERLHAQDTWPDKPVRIVVPLAPGGPADIVVRAVIDKMQPVLKQPLIVHNEPGANGNLGAVEVARATPDGHTWLWTSDTLLTVDPHVYAKPGFKPDDLMPVMRATGFGQTLVCKSGLGPRSVADLVGLARSRPLNYASGGQGRRDISPRSCSRALPAST